MNKQNGDICKVSIRADNECRSSSCQLTDATQMFIVEIQFTLFHSRVCRGLKAAVWNEIDLTYPFTAACNPPLMPIVGTFLTNKAL